MRRLLPILAALAVAGCKVGPDPTRPPNAATGSDGFVHAAPEQEGIEPVMGPWWERFGDVATRELVALALRSNNDLEVAAARILEAEALLGVAFGRLLPQVTLSAGVDRRRNSFSLPQIGRVQVDSTTYDVGAAAAWQVDLFGKLRRGREAAEWDFLASQAEAEALLHTVVAAVVRLRVSIATLVLRQEIARANTLSWEQTLRTVERRYLQGVASPLEYRLARENLAATRAVEPELEFQLASARHALDVLLGRQPGTGGPLEGALRELPSLDPPPVGIPAALLDRRPDLRAAELRQAAATARVGVAVADLYPDLTLGASGGYAADKISDLFRPETAVYGLLADAAWKVFSGGTLRSQVKAAEARARAAAAEYAQLVLLALEEVENALVREATARRSYAEVETRLEEATAAERLARERYERGVDGLIVLLETERRRRLAQIEVVLARQTVWNARIDLFLALGGDWSPIEEPPVEVTDAR